MDEYRTNEKSEKYKNLLKQFKEEKQMALKKYIEKNVNDALLNDPRKAFKAFDKLGERPGARSDGFFLPEHSRMSPKMVADDLADFFAKISKEFEPLNINQLPLRVLENLDRKDNNIPWFTEEGVYEILLSAKNPRSSVSGDLPCQLLIEFLPELAKPITLLWNKILATSQYPEAWKKETTVVIPKKSPPSGKGKSKTLNRSLNRNSKSPTVSRNSKSPAAVTPSPSIKSGST